VKDNDTINIKTNETIPNCKEDNGNIREYLGPNTYLNNDKKFSGMAQFYSKKCPLIIYKQYN
jgi:hypothetical protein